MPMHGTHLSKTLVLIYTNNTPPAQRMTTPLPTMDLADITKSKYDDLDAQIKRLTQQRAALRPVLMTAVFCKHLKLGLAAFPGVRKFSAHWNWKYSDDPRTEENRYGRLAVEYEYIEPGGQVIGLRHVTAYTYYNSYRDRIDPSEGLVHNLTVTGTDAYEYAGKNYIKVHPAPTPDSQQASESSSESDEGLTWASLMNHIMAYLYGGWWREHCRWVHVMQLEI